MVWAHYSMFLSLRGLPTLTCFDVLSEYVEERVSTVPDIGEYGYATYPTVHSRRRESHRKQIGKGKKGKDIPVTGHGGP
jgi:hypothetical protein